MLFSVVFIILRFPLAGLTIDSSTNQCSGIVSTTGDRFRAKDVVICNNAYMESIATQKDAIHRTVLITDTSIKPSEKEEVESNLSEEIIPNSMI